MSGRPRRSGQPSLEDVAALAGVSGQTVSRVVHGTAYVMPATREKVQRAVDELGYRTNTAARALATGRFGSVGVVCFDLTAVGNLFIIDGAIQQAQQHKYAVTLTTVSNATDADLQTALRGLADQAVDGLLVIEGRILDTPNLRLPDDLPVVVAEGARGIPYAAVGVNHAEGGWLAVQHLVGLGHETVHHISGLPSSYPAAARLQAWRDVLRKHHLPVPEPVPGDWSAASGYQAALRLLRDDDVSAIFAANDQMAAGALRAAADLGRRVPADLSVVGYDDTEMAAYLVPALTTVRQDLRSVGRRCMERLIPAMRDGEPLPPTLDLVSPELVVRASTGPPGSRDHQDWPLTAL
jgi:DNA-binding LacI/PurR family transcriptional regulator